MEAGVLLAAGESTRMGRPKALLPWRGTTLIEDCIRSLIAAVDRLYIVLGAEAERLLPLVEPHPVQIVLNQRYREGRATSIAAAARAIDPATSAILVSSVDQPRDLGIHRQVLTARSARQARIARAVHRGVHGHPTAFAGSLLSELAAVSEAEEGMKSLLRAHAAWILDVEIDSPLVLVNLNTPEEYERAATLFGGATRPYH